MISYLKDYCDHFSYVIKENLISKNDSVIGHINREEKWVIIGNNKLKYGDFAVLIAEGYFDLIGENDVNI